MNAKKILVWLIDPTLSIKALREALTLAKECGAELHALTVETVPRYPALIGEVIETPEASAKYNKLVAAAQEEAKQAGVNLEVHLAFGPKAKTAKEFIERNGMDLLVVGYAGRSVLYEWIVGDTFKPLVRLAPCMVLVVK
jgi:nucleotide-binding universal stress UspA family protein